MHPYIHAKKNPNKPALIMASSGKVTTYKELDERSNQIAHLFRQKGLKIGDGISIFMENNSRFLEILVYILHQYHRNLLQAKLSIFMMTVTLNF